uniref:Olfactory receptor n=1 Tax=Petromyzon marinus TaxID=7757 RepID=A0AAJ7TP76_PETMA|nr:putative olfactory receptor 1F2 [Petromyzon marinus]
MAFDDIVAVNCNGSGGDDVRDPNATFSVYLYFKADTDASAVAMYVYCVSCFVLSLVLNCLLVATVALSPKLHSPMYIHFLYLSVLNLLASVSGLVFVLSASAGRMRRIGVASCLAQSFFVYFTTFSEVLALGLMALDRYIAVCLPLRYPALVTNHLTEKAACGALVVCLSSALLVTLLSSRENLCADTLMGGVYCDVVALSRFTCPRTKATEIAVAVVSSALLLPAIGCMAFSYVQILRVLCAPGYGESRSKAIRTCTTQVMVFLLFYCTWSLAGIAPFLDPCFDPPFVHNLQVTAQILFVTLPPVLDPLVYGLRTKEVRVAVSRLIVRYGQYLFPQDRMLPRVATVTLSNAP